MSIEAASSNLITYHIHGLSFEEGTECIVSETADDFCISCGEKSITIPKKSIVEIYVEVENKKIERDEEDPQRTILHTMMQGGFYTVFDDVPQKRIDRMKYKNLVIVTRKQNTVTEISLRVPVEKWKEAENLARSFNRSRK